MKRLKQGGLTAQPGRSHSFFKRQGGLLARAALLAGASFLASASVAQAAPSLVVNNVGAPTVVGSGAGKRAIWTNAGTVGAQTVDIVGVITTATLNHNWTTTANRPSITSVGQDNIFIEWRLYQAGTYNITTDSGGTLVTADVHVQFNDVDGPSNERVYLPVCTGDIQWARIDKTATTGRAFGTVAGQAETFSLIGDKDYNQEPVSGVEAFWPNRNIFKMGRTANNGYLIRLDNPTYTDFDTLNYECADFQPPLAADDSKEGPPGNPTILDILANDSFALENNNPTNNNSLSASEFARSSVSLVAPSGATGATADSNGDVIGLTVPGEGTWAYSDTTGQLTFTPDPSFKGYATQIKYTVKNGLGVTSNMATVTVWYPALGVTKSSTFQDTNGDGYAQVGETIDYDYQVKAYGKDPLQAITISETGFTGAGTVPVPAYQSGDSNSDSKLDLSETWLYRASYILVAADMANPSIGNSATVRGQTPGGTNVSDVSDSANPGDGNGTGTSGPGPGNNDTTSTALTRAPIAAANDSQPATIFSGPGASNAFGVLGNDTLKGIAATPSTVTLSVVTPASHAGVTLDTAAGQVSVAASTPAATYTIDYRICETGNPSNCANARATVVVTAATAIAATADTPGAVPRSTGGSGIINVLANDSLGGSSVTIGQVNLTVTSPASNPGVTIDPATGLVSVTAGTPAGNYSIGYQICEKTNTSNCASSTVTVVVQGNTIAATGDSGPAVNGASGNPAAFNAFTNDNLNGSPIVLSQITATVTTPATPLASGMPVPSLNVTTGDVSVPAGTPAGNYTIAYKICENSDPANCSNASITVAVSAPGIAATNDVAPAVITLTGGSNLINVLTNDSLNGGAPAIGQVNLTVETPASNPGVTLDAASGAISVAAGTPTGSYQIAYKICDKINAANCALANVSVAVNPTPIVAAPDTPPAVNGTAGNASLVNAYANDSFNGAPVDLAKVTGTVVSPATPIGGGPVPVLDPATGLVAVPPLTPAGTYTIAYRLCENANPANCANSSVTVQVSASALIAADDSVTGINGASGAANAVNAFGGDSVNGLAASTANATLALAPGASVPAGLTFNPSTGNVSVAAATAAGTYNFDYQICEKLNPGNCKIARVTVGVSQSAIAAAPDTPPAVNGLSGNPGLVNAFTNDLLGGQPVDPTKIIGSVTTPASNPGVSMNPSTGLVSVTPNTPSGTYTIAYRICEVLNPANCSNSTVTVNVSAASIAAADDAPAPIPGIAGNPALINALTNDSFNGAGIDLAKVALTVTAPASIPGVALNTASGNVSVAPNTPAGTYAIDYRICELLNPGNCANARITVVVRSAAIAAIADAPTPVNGANGSASLINAYANDTLNGAPFTPAAVTGRVVTPASNPGVVLDPTTGTVSVAPGTKAGSYTIAYQICEKLNPGNCATTNVTIAVEAPAILAVDDNAPNVRSGIGQTGAINVFANDKLNGQPIDSAKITTTIVTPATDPGITLDTATGLFSVAATVPPGTYSLTYQICETLNPANCMTATVSVVVEEPISAISGTVFTDANNNGKLDPNEPRRENWIVEIVRNGAVVATTRTAADGTYSVGNLRSGPGYTVVFRNPENNVVYDKISNLTLGANVTVVDQDQPIDPSGIIYNSITRQPIAGVTVRLTDANGVPLPAVCFIDPSQVAQTTGASGFYRFDVVTGAAPQCPSSETVYRIAVTPPVGFASGSTVLLPQSTVFDPTGLPAPVRISPSANPPQDSDPVFYIALRLAPGDPDVINNHIALDPFLTRTPLIVTKTSPRRSASIGDLVPYEITVRNTESARRAGVNVFDILPPGMKFVAGTASINGAAAAPLDQGRELVWKNQIFPANGSVRYNLTLVVGAGITTGERVNTGVARNAADGATVSNRGTAVVSITPSTVFDCSELLGKVFEDRNGDGYQDPGEPPVPGVRLATVNGQLITTDDQGRYHIACAAVPDARIGSNFVLKLDVRTLPLGWVVTTDNPRSIRLTRGKFGELNFGVVSPQALPGWKVPPTTRREGGE